MDVIQFLGFIISLIAFIIISMRWLKEQREKQCDPQGYAIEKARKEKALRDFLKSLEGDMDEDEQEERRHPQSIPPPPPIRPNVTKKVRPPTKPPEARSMDTFKFETTSEKQTAGSTTSARDFNTSLDDRYKNLLTQDKIVSAAYRKPSTSAYEVRRHFIPSYGQIYLRRLPSLRDMAVYQAIMGPPKGL